MAPKVKPPKIVYETKESMYERAVMMIDDAKWTVSPKFRRMHFQRIVEMLETLEGYKDSGELIKLCEQRIAQTEPEEQEMTYTGAVYIQEHAALKEEYARAAALFAKIPGYKDADARKKTCSEKEKQIDRSERRKTGVTIAIAAVIILSGVVFFMSKVRSMGKVDVHGTETEVTTESLQTEFSEETQVTANASDTKETEKE